MTTEDLRSRWGAEDSLGAMNLLGPETVLRSLQAVQRGEIYDLSRRLEAGMPTPDFHGAYFGNTHYTPDIAERWHDENFGKVANGYSAANMRLSMSDQSGTHIDGLNHISVKRDGVYYTYGPTPYGDITTAMGTTRLGIDEMPPLVARGVMVDVASIVEEPLGPGEVIQPEQLDQALADQGVVVERGDVVLVRTGWGVHWSDPARYLEGEPGLGKACADWAVQHEIVAWGADNFGIDPVPFEEPGVALPMHIEMLVKNGIRLIENLDLEPLAEAGVHEFCFVLAPLKLRGASGSPVRPFAIA